MSRMFIAFAAVLAADLSTLPAGAETLSLVGASTKICQLTGETDWDTNLPTAAQTNSQFGLDSVDLGFPVDSGFGPLYFLFGDAFPVTHPPFGTVLPDDALGWTMRTSAPDSTSCVDLRLATSAPHKFAHPTVWRPIQQGTYNVPTSGVFLNKTLYAFFWTNHCAVPGDLLPLPGAPLRYPPSPNAACPETGALNSIGASVLARAAPGDPVAFRQTAPFIPTLLQSALLQMPSGFVYASAANPPRESPPNVQDRPPGIPVFGVPRFRASIPYLAIAPEATFGDPATWSFFAGHAAGHPVWVNRQQWESGRNASGEWVPPAGAEIYDAMPVGERCVGEHSVTWNTPLHSWLLLYSCGPWRIESRTAPEPWGPWSPPTVLLSVTHDPGVICTLIMSVTGCPNLARRNYWPKFPNGSYFPGIFYAPFVMNRFTQPTQGQPGTRSATIYWLLSTWNPYNVVVMQSTLQVSP